MGVKLLTGTLFRPVPNEKPFPKGESMKRKFQNLLVWLGLTICLLTLSSTSQSENVWNKKVLDSALLIWSPSIKVSPNNIPIVSFSEIRGKSNGFRIWLNQNGNWKLKPIDPSLEGSHIYSSSMKVDSNERLHFTFLKRDEGGLGPLKQIYSLLDETSWTFEQLDDKTSVGSIDLVLISDDSPVVCYNVFYQLTPDYQYELMCKSKDEGSWGTLYSRSGYGFIWSPTIGLDSRNLVHATYDHIWYSSFTYDVLGHELVYEHQTETGWVNERLAGGYTYNNSIINDAIVLDSNDYPHMFYRILYSAANTTQLYHTYKDETGWHAEVVRTASWIDGVSAAIGSNDEIHIVYRSEGWKDDPYFDPYRNFMVYGHKSSGSWKAIALDSCKLKKCEDDEFATSIAVDSYDRPYVVYTFPKLIGNRKYQKIVYATLKTEILAPNGGEIIPSGSDYTIRWGAPVEAATFKLQYSLDKGLTWKPMAGGLTGRSHVWRVPDPTKNRRNCLVRVKAFDTMGRLVGVDRSDSRFSIEIAP